MARVCDARAAYVVAAIAGFTLLATAGAPIGAVSAEPATVTGVTTKTDGHNLQVIIQASAPVHFQVQPVRPAWIVVDIANAQLGSRIGTLPSAVGVVERIRLGQFTPDVVRVVVECVNPVRFTVAAGSDPSTVIVAIPGGSDRPAAGAPAAPASPSGQQSGSAMIVPGRSIGAVRLGMTVHDVEGTIGRAKGTEQRPGVGVDYTWYAPPADSGLGLRATAEGVVRQIWILNDSGYRTREGLHAGSTDAEVKAALGAHSWTLEVDSKQKSTTLMYEKLGVWFTVQPNAANPSRSVVVRIDVMEPGSATAPQRPSP
jgi:hypothetical protein